VRLAPVPTFVFLAAVAAVLGGWWLFERTEAGRYQETRLISQSPSQIHIQMDAEYKVGEIVHEVFKYSDIDGVSSMDYSATTRSGTTAHVTPPARATKDKETDVAVLFGIAQQDGIWDLTSKPPRGDTNLKYTIYVSQLEAGQFGEHRFSFTDPHYWATTGGRQYHITLDRNKPVPDLVKLRSTTISEPRYEWLVADILGFGSQRWKAAVIAEAAKLRAPRGAPSK